MTSLVTYWMHHCMLPLYCFHVLRCDGKEKCTFRVNNDVFGDPCPDTFKYIEVQYYCEKGNFYNNSNLFLWLLIASLTIFWWCYSSSNCDWKSSSVAMVTDNLYSHFNCIIASYERKAENVTLMIDTTKITRPFIWLCL